jgi:hypothetical protein
MHRWVAFETIRLEVRRLSYFMDLCFFELITLNEKWNSRMRMLMSSKVCIDFGEDGHFEE